MTGGPVPHGCTTTTSLSITLSPAAATTTPTMLQAVLRALLALPVGP
jgi:hypothetical protein